MDEAGKSFLVDNFEIIYNNAAQLKLAESHKKDLARAAAATEAVEPLTKVEIKALRGEVAPLLYGLDQAKLAPGAIQRADIVGWKTPYYTFDHPLPVGPLVLENLAKPREFKDIIAQHKGKIIWITRTHKGDHSTERNNRARTDQRSVTVFNRHYRLMTEYRPKGVVVLGVSAHDGGHRHFSTNQEDRILSAFEIAAAHEAMAEDFGLPFGQVIYGFRPSAFDGIFVEQYTNQMRLWTKTMRGRVVNGGFAGYGAEAIINQDGKVVFRGSGPDGFMYWNARYCMDRLLDPTFDVACRQDFRNPDMKHYKSPLLPKQEVTSEGLYYRDDFESYENAYDLGLHPRWGFSYRRPPNPDTPQVFAGEGVKKSKAILLNMFHPGDQFCGNKAGDLAARHELPEPLTEGHLSMQIRRGPTMKFRSYGSPEIFRLGITVFGPDNKPCDTLTTTGGREKEQFVTAPTADFLKNWNCYKLKNRQEDKIVPTGIAMAKDTWQEIKVVCKPGKKAVILIDGKTAATLASESITAIELRAEVRTSYYVDDVEVFYHGDGTKLSQSHAEAIKASLKELQTLWKTEATDWAAHVLKYKGRR